MPARNGSTKVLFFCCLLFARHLSNSGDLLPRRLSTRARHRPAHSADLHLPEPLLLRDPQSFFFNFLLTPRFGVPRLGSARRSGRAAFVQPGRHGRGVHRHGREDHGSDREAEILPLHQRERDPAQLSLLSWLLQHDHGGPSIQSDPSF